MRHGSLKSTGTTSGRASTYVLITAARNEEATIWQTIESVANQSMLPQRWVIVSDGSVDGTDDLILKAASTYSFIRYIRRNSDVQRSFASKAESLNMAARTMGLFEYDFIGNLDADVTIDSEYFEKVVERMLGAPMVGIAGGMIHNMVKGRWVPCLQSPDWSVSGAVQMFRREVFEAIGGYLPLRYGGIDTVAEYKCRMKGWRVKTFVDLPVYHHVAPAKRRKGPLQNHFFEGRRDCCVGNHPLFEVARCFWRWRESPVFIGSILRLGSYLFYRCMGLQYDLGPELSAYIEKEQLGRLKRLVFKVCL